MVNYYCEISRIGGLLVNYYEMGSYYHDMDGGGTWLSVVVGCAWLLGKARGKPLSENLMSIFV